MTTPSCKTCPWKSGRICVHVESPRFDCLVEVPDKDHGWGWKSGCSLHPDAPKPIYEIYHETNDAKPPEEPGWEPYGGYYAGEQWGGVALWRRIVGYTKAGE